MPERLTDAQKLAKLRDALEDAEEFIESVERWQGSAPEEREETLANIGTALTEAGEDRG